MLLWENLQSQSSSWAKVFKVQWQSPRQPFPEVSGLLKNPQDFWRGGEVMVRSSHHTQKGNFGELVPARRKMFSQSRLPVARKTTLSISPSPQVLSFLFGTMKTGCPGRLGKCVLFSWLCASPGHSCSGPRQLQVTHCLSLVPADSLLWTCLKLNHSLRTGTAFSYIYS